MTNRDEKDFYGLTNKEFAEKNADRKAIVWFSGKDYLATIAGWYSNNCILLYTNDNYGYRFVDFSHPVELTTAVVSDRRYIYTGNNGFVLADKDTKLIDAFEYAKEYMGRQVIVSNQYHTLFDCSATIIGKCNAYFIIIAFDDENINLKATMYNGETFIDNEGNKKKGYAIRPYFLKLYEPLKQALLYSGICKFCKAKAMVRNHMTFCSNGRCRKSRNEIKQRIQFKALIKSKSSIKNEQVRYIFCPICDKPAIYSTSYGEDVQSLTCGNNHNFKHKVEIGEVVGGIVKNKNENVLDYGYERPAYEWNGKFWIEKTIPEGCKIITYI